MAGKPKKPFRLNRLPKRPAPLESSEQSRGMQKLDQVGFCVHNLAQARETMQTGGLGDVYAYHPGLRLALWWDAKRERGSKVYPEQLQFMQIHDGGPVTVLIGPCTVIDAFLVKHGLAVPMDIGGVRLIPRCTPAWFDWHRVQREAAEARKRARNDAALRKAARKHDAIHGTTLSRRVRRRPT